jgi:hypothetical protein
MDPMLEERRQRMGATFEAVEVSVEGRFEESVFACAHVDKARERERERERERVTHIIRNGTIGTYEGGSEGGMRRGEEVWRRRTLAVDGIGVVGGAAADDEERLHCSPRSRRRPLVSLSLARARLVSWAWLPRRKRHGASGGSPAEEEGRKTPSVARRGRVRGLFAAALLVCPGLAG